ncbi:MAG: hypothetical protein ABSG88_07345 [Bradyrhizobium sp.]
MRRTEANGRTRQNPSVITMRAVGLAVLSLSVGLVVTAGTARAGDDDRTLSEKFMDGFYGTIRGTSMDNRGIDYRERSPLVVPPSLDLPPPASAANAPAPNWPKDPDERQRKAVIAAKKKAAPPPSRVMVSTAGAVQAQPINIAPPTDPQAGTPPAPGTTRPAYASDRNGTALTDPVYDKPGDLFTGGASDLADSIGIGNLFGTSKKAVPVDPGTEPARQALTQPPIGYQTPSPNYAYGEEKKGLLDGTSSPDKNPLSQMSSASSVVH